MADADPNSHSRPEKRSGDLEAPARRDQLEGEGATRGTSRMEAFADGVFAISFTLPIVEIALPAIGQRGQDLGSQLFELWPSYLGYVLASFVIGLYWVHHHFSGAIYRTTGHWFLVATALFLAMIGFIAYPCRVLTESIVHPGTAADASAFFVNSLALTSITWLLKWNVGMRRGNVDARLQHDYVTRLNRRYWLKTAWNVAAGVLVFYWWQGGLAMAGLGLMQLVWPPETPRYRTEAPVIEGETD